MDARSQIIVNGDPLRNTGRVSGAFRAADVLVENSSGKFDKAQSAADAKKQLWIANQREGNGKAPNVDFVANENVTLYGVTRDWLALVNAKAANYAKNQALTIGTTSGDAGVVRAAATGEPIIGYVEVAKNVSATDVTNKDNEIKMRVSPARQLA